jgi:alpha-beta hydrolase superfamily lysophospholipase
LDFTTDVLGAPYEAATLPLAPDAEGEAVATLVRRRADGSSARASRRAVLHVHGFADYFVELDLAWERITERDEHSSVVISAHSTGGLVVALWAHARQPEALAGKVLNSPWLDLQGPAWLRSPAANVALGQLGLRQPMRVMTREVSGVYAKSLHRDHEGEWDFDLAWKPVESFPVRFGWLRAIRAGHAQVHRGLDIRCPVLVLSSDRTSFTRTLDERAHTSDIVLDVKQIRRWASSLGTHVTSVAVPGAKHDVILSRPEARAFAYAEIERWLTTYVL